MKLKIVESSMIQAVGYNAKTRELEVVFNSGRTYVYEGVPPKTHKELMAAESKGGGLCAPRLSTVIPAMRLDSVAGKTSSLNIYQVDRIHSTHCRKFSRIAEMRGRDLSAGVAVNARVVNEEIAYDVLRQSPRSVRHVRPHGSRNLIEKVR